MSANLFDLFRKLDMLAAMSHPIAAHEDREPPKPTFARHEPPPRPGRMRDRDAKQQALIMAALKLFASKGYEATTTREIATCAVAQRV